MGTIKPLHLPEMTERLTNRGIAILSFASFDSLAHLCYYLIEHFIEKILEELSMIENCQLKLLKFRVSRQAVNNRVKARV